MAYQKVDKLAVDDYIIDLSDYMKKADVINMVAPVGHVMIRLDNTNPGSLPGYEGTTWQKISEGKVLIGANSAYPLGSSANGSMKHNHTNPTTNGSSEANTGGTTLTAAQSGMPSHNHAQNAHTHPKAGAAQDYSYLTTKSDVGVNSTKRSFPSANTSGVHFLYMNNDAGGIAEAPNIPNATATNQAAAARNASSAHSHTMAHTHTQGNTGDATIPYLAVNIWIRTA